MNDTNTLTPSEHSNIAVPGIELEVRTTAAPPGNTSWHSYPGIYNLGHHALMDLFDGPVIIEEKVDGSQFSFGIFDGQLKCRSKGQQIIIDHPEGMFSRAVESVKERAHLLKDGYTYRAEYLQKPKHNTLSYSRHPEGFLIVFDVNAGEECYLPYEAKAAEAKRIGLEIVPLIHEGIIHDATEFRDLIDRESILGGCKVEGVVIKNYAKFGPDKKALMGKFVSETFKESHQGQWKAANPTGADIVQSIILGMKTEARWRKAVQHLREAGEIEGDVRDIGKLLKEIATDLDKECIEQISQELLRWALPKIKRGINAGFPDWYKQELLTSQFADTADSLRPNGLPTAL